MIISGGKLNVASINLSAITHEICHAAQSEVSGMTTLSTGLEVEANLFTNTIGWELGFSTPSVGADNSDFNKAYNSLLDGFNENAWKTTIKTFKVSDFNINNRYKNFNTNYYNPTIIKEMYPLW